ncbi:riboflavin synthase, alpha subunit [Wigglesworthia glossinidia endosymbiont of Glossina morsitans morsitans (Yale colony)]|uniref:Riboflavin synthase n=1 Tax=Wigglesworthia glossinidia endosymbiont of Glossina morsitans morsitans (Yale colony) TaxID=1142511 RepID=H6Q4Y2_WIGGL|nr:riboflavin synthase [Wigglesworthia glossinidia]AFA41265.1 riboflavin synthase, alpha subunit [Wigglesworthia glossinidia endosymbiont of Glossina morsitans morsitans (Yale colony)]
MFTGIIQGIGTVTFLKKSNNLFTYSVLFPKNLLSNLSIGDSISNNGCCLTITKIENEHITFDLIQETIKITNFSNIKVGDRINLEKSTTLCQPIGGHVMSGHVTCCGKISKVNVDSNSKTICVEVLNKKLMKYFFYKGYIGIEGISLTISKMFNNGFYVHLIPETISKTTLNTKIVGDLLNIEIDLNIQAIVDTTEKIISKKFN